MREKSKITCREEYLRLFAGFVKIVQPIDGAILNRHNGKQRSDGLEIQVKVIAPSRSKVTVNGVEAEAIRGPLRFFGYNPVTGDKFLYNEFVCNVIIKEEENKIIACTESGEKAGTDSVIVLWDRNSIKRYRFSSDNNILFLKDLSVNTHKYGSIFDNDCMNFWRQMHETYGSKIHLNIFYQTDGFNLSKMPDKYKSEWEDSSDWLRLSFHALQCEPGLYINASYQEMKRDFLLVTKEIERFAGKSLLSSFTTIHWADASLEACRALRDNGIKGLIGLFTFDPRTGKPTLSYYLDEEKTKYLRDHGCGKDAKEELMFIKQDLVINGTKREDIIPTLNSIASDPDHSEVMEVMVHEEYFYPELHYKESIDVKERVETAIEWLTKNGYKSVFYEEGFLGSPR